jgi:hypothetical protein
MFSVTLGCIMQRLHRLLDSTLCHLQERNTDSVHVPGCSRKWSMVLSSKLGVYGGVASGPHTLRTTSVLAAAAS